LEAPFEVLAHELTDSSLSRILPIGKVLGVSADRFYEHLIQKKVSQLQGQMKSANDSSSTFSHISFLEFRPLLLKIKDFQQAMSLCVFVGGNFPRGEDRISAYRLAMSFSQKWIASLGNEEGPEMEKAKTGGMKVKNLLNVAETEYSLQVHGLQILDKYVPKPSVLLMQLLTLNDTYPALSADIFHSIAIDVAQRSGVELDKLKLMILQVRFLNSSVGFPIQIPPKIVFLFRIARYFCFMESWNGEFRI
jgi:hypothetical protein